MTSLKTDHKTNPKTSSLTSLKTISLTSSMTVPEAPLQDEDDLKGYIFFGELKIVISWQFGSTDTDTDMYDVNKMSIWPFCWQQFHTL